MKYNKHSIFHKYYNYTKFVDRYLDENEKGIDVLIPVINTNELWRTNLHSFYREIPIKNLLIGDGGCTDDTIKLLKNFPRVKKFDQKGYKSQGYAIKELMLNVETEYFIYLHADVYLPEGWFDTMYSYRDRYDWFECFRKMTVLFEFPSVIQHQSERAYSGSQFGRTNLMQNTIKNVIDDDFLQRNEDIIFMELIKSSKGKYAKINETFHYHQVTNREGGQEPDFESVSILKKSDPSWERKIFNMQYKGIIKYLQPNSYLINNVYLSILKLINLDDFNWKEFRNWVKKTNPIWLQHINKRSFYLYQIKKLVNGFFNLVKKETQLGKFMARKIIK